jgi:hypothetical protein
MRGVRLEVIRADGRFCTTRSAIIRFYKKLSGFAGATANTAITARREAHHADAVLDSAGIM